jgi:hypothetical protein
MKDVLIRIRNAAFAVAIAVALSFGAAEALSGTPDLSRPPCDSPPGSCTEDDDCYAYCTIGGSCFPVVWCCLCYDR